MSDTKPQIQEAHRMLSQKKPQKTKKLHLSISYSNARKSELKKKILKKARDGWRYGYLTYRGAKVRATFDVSEVMPARRGGSEILPGLRDKKQTKILILRNTFQNRRRNKDVLRQMETGDIRWQQGCLAIPGERSSSERRKMTEVGHVDLHQEGTWAGDRTRREKIKTFLFLISN